MSAAKQFVEKCNKISYILILPLVHVKSSPEMSLDFLKSIVNFLNSFPSSSYSARPSHFFFAVLGSNAFALNVCRKATKTSLQRMKIQKKQEKDGKLLENRKARAWKETSQSAFIYILLYVYMYRYIVFNKRLCILHFVKANCRNNWLLCQFLLSR